MKNYLLLLLLLCIWVYNYDCRPECHCIRHSAVEAHTSFCPERFMVLGLLNSWHLNRICVIFFSWLSPWRPDTNKWRIQHSWYMLETILGWLCAGQMNKKRCCMMILVEVVLRVMTGTNPTDFVEVRLCIWNAAWSNIKQKKVFSPWHVLRKAVMIVFISHLHREEMRVVVSSSRLEEGTLQKPNRRLSLGSTCR